MIPIRGNDINTTDGDSSNDAQIHDSVLAEDQISPLQPSCPRLQQALTTYVVTGVPLARRPPANDRPSGNYPLVNSLSRVCATVAKYPDEATFRNYGDFQTWMYMHSNKQPPIDICQSLSRLVLNQSGHYGDDVRFNLHLITAEVYQAIGQTHQAYCEYEQATMLYQLIGHSFDPTDRARKKKKLKEVRMKLKFQSQFQVNLLDSGTNKRSDSEVKNFLRSLSARGKLSAEECCFIWRELVLLLATNPSVAKPGAEFLLSYANSLGQHHLQYANSHYVALNLLLFHYGQEIFTQGSHMAPLVTLETIARHFEEHGNQSKQFSAVHKMAHVWGTAAVVFHLAADEHRYLVCASIIRVSFEALGIQFLSSGIESLYILAQKWAPQFLTMMAHHPNVKLPTPACLNYFRRLLNDSVTHIRYSSEAIDQYVVEVFNLDASEHQQT